MNKAAQRAAMEKMMADFAAKGGKVRKVCSTASAGISDKQFYLAARGEISLREPSENELIAQRHRGATDHMGRTVITNGLGEIIGHE